MTNGAMAGGVRSSVATLAMVNPSIPVYPISITNARASDRCGTVSPYPPTEPRSHPSFRAFAQVVDAAQNGFVVLDTAPTGHTLLLLDAAESYHREVARSTGAVPEAVRALLPRLRDPHFTRILLVTLAEATPVFEAARLRDDLRRAGIEPYGWVVNASLSASGTTHPLLAARARMEEPQLRRVEEQLATHTWIVPWEANPLVGADALLALSSQAR